MEISFYCVVGTLLVTKAYRHLGIVVSVIGLVSSSIALYRLAQHYGLVVLPFADRIVAFAAKPRAAFLLLRPGLYFAFGAELWLFLFQRKSVVRGLLLTVLFAGGVAELQWHVSEFDYVLHLRHATERLPPELPLVIWTVCLIIIIVSVVANSAITHAAGPLGARIVKRLGLATYPIYLLHQEIGRVAVERLHGVLPDLLVLTLMVLAVSTFCIFVIPVLEAPLQRRLRSWLQVSKRKSELPAASLP